jgi:hypothetical protein
MDPSRNFQYIIFVTNLYSILLINLEREPENFTSRTKQSLTALAFALTLHFGLAARRLSILE